MFHCNCGFITLRAVCWGRCGRQDTGAWGLRAATRRPRSGSRRRCRRGRGQGWRTAGNMRKSLDVITVPWEEKSQSLMKKYPSWKLYIRFIYGIKMPSHFYTSSYIQGFAEIRRSTTEIGWRGSDKITDYFAHEVPSGGPASEIINWFLLQG